MNEENNNSNKKKKDPLDIFNFGMGIVVSVLILFTIVLIIKGFFNEINNSNKYNKRNNQNVVEEKEQNYSNKPPKIITGCNEVNLKDSKFKYDKYIVEEMPDIFLADVETDESLGHIKTISPTAKIKFQDTFNNNFIIEDDDNFYLYNYDSKKYYDLRLDSKEDYFIPVNYSGTSYQELVGFTNKDHKFYSLAACDFIYEGDEYELAYYNNNLIVAFTKRYEKELYIGRYDKKEIIHKETLDIGDAFTIIPEIKALSNNYLYIGYVFSDHDGNDSRNFFITDMNYNHLIEGSKEVRPEYYIYGEKLYIMHNGEFYYFNSNGKKSDVVKDAKVVAILDDFFLLYKDDKYLIYRGTYKLTTVVSNVSTKFEGNIDKFTYKMYFDQKDRIVVAVTTYDDKDVPNTIYYFENVKNNYVPQESQ